MGEQTATSDRSLNDPASALDSGLRIAERLRKCLRFDSPAPTESDLEAAARDAANELEILVAHRRRIEDWQQRGEALLERRGIGAEFSLGAWWADRPWRNRDA